MGNRKKRAGKAKLNGAKVTKPRTWAKRSVRHLKRAKIEASKLSIADLTTEHLEPPFKRFWADMPGVVGDSKSDTEAMSWAEPTASTELVPFTKPTPKPTTPEREVPSWPFLGLVPVFNNYHPLSSVRNEPAPGFPAMSSSMPPPAANMASGTTGSKVFYFAYGTDISVSAMKVKYPGTEYVSPATLFGYEWLIGSRNKPIIRPSVTEEVHGILYLLPSSDVTQITVRAYYYAAAVSARLTVSLHVDESKKTPANPGWGVASRGPNMPGECRALVFVAGGPETEGVLEGFEGEEIIMGMNRGIMEAKMDGLDEEWADRVLRKWIPFPKTPEGVYWVEG